MTDAIRVLIVDDEEPIRKLLSKGFQRSRKYKYEVSCANSPNECIELEPFRESEFDVCIIDLGFDCDDRELVGFKMLLGLVSQCITVVYSGHPTVPNVVRAMQLGADDFVSKTDVPPHDLVKHVDNLITDRKSQQEHRRRIDDFVQQQNGTLSQQYLGRVLAIVVNEVEPQVAVDGATRLDALLRYAELRKTRPEWPVDPYLYIVPGWTDAQEGNDD